MRKTDIDIARALCSLLVVFGHSTLALMHPEANDSLTSTRMPLFLMLSGLFFKPGQPLGALVRTKTDALLKPYLVMAVLLGAYAALRGQVNDPMSYVAGVATFNGPQMPGWLFPLWFLCFLWLLHTTGAVVYRLTGFARRSTLWRVCFVLTLLSTGQALLPGQLFTQQCVDTGLGYTGLPFGLDLLPLGMAWFLLGHLLEPVLMHKTMPNTWVWAWTAIFIGCQVLAAPRLDLFTRESSDLVFTNLAALSGALALTGWSQVMSKVSGLASLLGPIGRNGLYVLMWHAPIQSLLGKQLRLWAPAHAELASWATLVLVVMACQGIGLITRRHAALRMCFERIEPTRRKPVLVEPAQQPA